MQPTPSVHRSYGKARKTIACRFWCNGSSDPATVQGDDDVTGVVHTTTGVYTASLAQSHYQVIGVGAALGTSTSTAAGVVNVKINNVASTSNTTVVLTRLNTSNAASDDDAHADNWLSFTLEVEDGR